jgi:hypothetical protein
MLGPPYGCSFQEKSLITIFYCGSFSTPLHFHIVYKIHEFKQKNCSFNIESPNQNTVTHLHLFQYKLQNKILHHYIPKIYFSWKKMFFSVFQFTYEFCKSCSLFYKMLLDWPKFIKWILMLIFRR